MNSIIFTNEQSSNHLNKSHAIFLDVKPASKFIDNQVRKNSYNTTAISTDINNKKNKKPNIFSIYKLKRDESIEIKVYIIFI